MQSTDDALLLRRFVESASDEAFAALVARHVNLVYSVALRQCGNPQHAEEITHVVFVILAKKAARVRHQALSSWLFQTTRLTTINFLRSEARRHAREQEAYMQSTLNESGSETWLKIAPLLDEAVSGLREKDRRAILLRFYEGRNLREVGTVLNTSEVAAEKRVSRALEKIRRFFSKRGVDSNTGTIAGAISAHSVHAAPALLAKSATAIALTKGAAATGSTLTLIKGALKIMAWTKAKTAIVAGVVVLLAAGTTVVTVKEIQAHRTYPWEVPKADFQVFYKAPAGIFILPAKFRNNGSACSDSSRGAMGISVDLKQIFETAYQVGPLHTVVTGNLPADKYDFIAKLVGPMEPHKNMPQDENWTIALQKELTRKFGIQARMEMRDTDCLVLRPANTGTQGFTPSTSMPGGHALVEKPGSLSFHQQPAGTLIGTIQRNFKVPIVNETGLDGAYDFTLQWDEPDPKHPNLDGLKQALHDQLGLDLVPSREPIEMLVINASK